MISFKVIVTAQEILDGLDAAIPLIPNEPSLAGVFAAMKRSTSKSFYYTGSNLIRQFLFYEEHSARFESLIGGRQNIFGDDEKKVIE